MLTLNIIPLNKGHISAIYEIERESFRSPWTLEAFLAELHNPASVSFVAVVEDEVAGYIIAWEFEHSIHIGNLAVKKYYRRKGIATRLIKKILKIAEEKHHTFVSLEVRRSNLPAIRLYEKMGFKLDRVIKRYYSDNFEDALIYKYSIT